MSVIIGYNSENIFGTLNIPTPNMSRSSKEVIYGDKKGVVDEITLSGFISIKSPPQDCDYFSLLTSKRNSLMNAFSVDFKDLEIVEDGNTILKKEFSKVLSIDFPSSNNVKTLEYSIVIECMDESLHNNFFGVSDPVNETSFSLSEKNLYTIRRSISAKGLNLQDGNLEETWLDSDQIKHTTSISSSLQNAIDFVTNNSGKDNVDLSIIEDDLKLHLISKSENIDRIRSTFTISEEYIADKNDKVSDGGVIQYTVESAEAKGSVHEAVVNGTISIGIDEDFSKARDRVKNINFFLLAQESEVENLVRLPVSSDIKENENSGQISFSIVFNNDTSFDECGVGRIYNFSINELGENITCSVSGSFVARGPIKERWNLVKKEFELNGKAEILAKAQASVDEHFSNSVKPLNSAPETKTIVENKKLGKIGFEFSFSNKIKLEKFKKFDYNIDMSLPTPNVSVDMNTGGGNNHYFVTRAGFTKPTITISASGEYLSSISKDVALSSVASKVEDIFEGIEIDFGYEGKHKVTANQNSGYSKNANTISYTKTIEYFGAHVYI
jgi:hypothetical protein